MTDYLNRERSISPDGFMETRKILNTKGLYTVYSNSKFVNSPDIGTSDASSQVIEIEKKLGHNYVVGYRPSSKESILNLLWGNVNEIPSDSVDVGFSAEQPISNQSTPLDFKDDFQEVNSWFTSSSVYPTWNDGSVFPF